MSEAFIVLRRSHSGRQVHGFVEVRHLRPRNSGLIAVREAVKRSGDRRRARRGRDHGLCPAGGTRAEPRATGCDLGRSPGSGRGAHDQQGLRIGPEGRRARGAIDPGGRSRRGRRRRDGEHEPLALSRARMLARACASATASFLDSMVHDGLWDIYNDFHMGMTGEKVAEKYGITREEQDAYAAEQPRARRPRPQCRAGAFDNEIVTGRNPPAEEAIRSCSQHDESIRPDSTPEVLAKLQVRPSRRAAPSPRATPRAATTRPRPSSSHRARRCRSWA